ncbi:hypothetical protein [Kitasatospora cheerisanensis]|uniref:Uncharacterized protein n=1 Tax=Kitasatospora cheerisanensis KCTC 2395 TaxID=1348663 RepID=A0A066Z2P1_9ACTN|nr:hypothetical protein [Kitasatospora cheerisanensis]KDN88048.1 hypothetical protein KCH_01250 [Kitasatospora cheerisanensis KCTC 2395]
MVAGGTARLLVGNSGEAPLELTVEPWADTCWIPPGRTFAVVTHSAEEEALWPGAVRPHEPFEVDHRPDSVTVWPYGSCYHLTDELGVPVEAADWDCPQGPPAC